MVVTIVIQFIGIITLYGTVINDILYKKNLNKVQKKILNLCSNHYKILNMVIIIIQRFF